MSEKQRILALDVGSRYIGVAVGECKTGLVIPVGSIEAMKSNAVDAVLELAKERNIHEVLVGMPYSSKGERNPQCDKVERFCRRLRRRSDLKIIYTDEHLTSFEAKEILNLRGSRMERYKKDGKLDATAACVILQSYFSSICQQNPPSLT